LKRVIASAGSLRRKQTSEEEEMVSQSSASTAPRSIAAGDERPVGYAAPISRGVQLSGRRSEPMPHPQEVATRHLR